MASTSLEGEEGFSWPKPAYLHWVSLLEERPVERKVVSFSACLNTWDKVALWCPRPRRGLLQQRRIILGVSKHQGNLALISAHLVPTPDERHAESSVVSSPVCINTKMTRDFGDYD